MKPFFAVPSLAALAIAAIVPSAAAQEARASIAFDFDLGARGGQVMVALFNTEAAYDGGAPVRAEMIPADGNRARIVFEDLPEGDYALKTFHDMNGDGRMNTNPFGMPVEPFAFSNNAVGNMGPASWERARFHAAGETAQSITLR